MTYKTYEEWKLLGTPVLKGQKSHRRNEKGEAVFGESQTTKINNTPRYRRRGSNFYSGDTDWDFDWFDLDEDWGDRY